MSAVLTLLTVGAGMHELGSGFSALAAHRVNSRRSSRVDIDKWLREEYDQLRNRGFHTASRQGKLQLLDNARLLQFFGDMPKGLDLHTHLVACASRRKLLERVAHRKPGSWVVRQETYGAVASAEVLPTSFSKSPYDTGHMIVETPLEDFLLQGDWWKYFVYRGSLSEHGASSDPSYDAWNEFTIRGFLSVRKLLSQRDVFRDIFLPLVMEELDDMRLLGFEPRVSPFNKLWSVDPHTSDDVSGRDYVGYLVEAAARHNIECNIVLSFSKETELPSDYLEKVKALIQAYGDHIKGFDFVGHEDSGKPLSDYRGTAEDLKNLGLVPVPHAGESNWPSGRANDNFREAVAMGARRIGHCLAGCHLRPPKDPLFWMVLVYSNAYTAYLELARRYSPRRIGRDMEVLAYVAGLKSQLADVESGERYATLPPTLHQLRPEPLALLSHWKTHFAAVSAFKQGNLKSAAMEMQTWPGEQGFQAQGSHFWILNRRYHDLRRQVEKMNSGGG